MSDFKDRVTDAFIHWIIMMFLLFVGMMAVYIIERFLFNFHRFQYCTMIMIWVLSVTALFLLFISVVMCLMRFLKVYIYEHVL